MYLQPGLSWLVFAAMFLGEGYVQPPANSTKKPIMDGNPTVHAKTSQEPLPAGSLIRTGKVRSDDGGMICSVAFSPDGKMLASGSDDQTVHLWEAATGKPIRQIKGVEDAVRSVAFSPDGKILASGGDDQIIRLWEAANGKLIRTLAGHENLVLSLSFSPNGKLLVSGSHDQTLRLWDVASGKELRQLKKHREVVRSVVFSPDGRTIASGSDDQFVHLWDTDTGKHLRQFKQTPSHAIWTIAFSPNGKLLASAGKTNAIHVWDVATGKEIQRLKTPRGDVLAIAFSPDGWTLVSGGTDRVLRLWEVVTGKEIRSWQGHQGWVLAVAFAPHVPTVASGSVDSTALVWDLTDWGKDGRLPKPNLAAEDLSALWTHLAGDDARTAHQAIWTLVSAHRQAVPFLQERLQPKAPVSSRYLAQLIADLDNERFMVRKKASEALGKLGEMAAPALQRFVASKPPLEPLRRAKYLLDKLLEPPSSDHVRVLRALMILERIGSPEARTLLKTVAKGAPEARLTREAKAALSRVPAN